MSGNLHFAVQHAHIVEAIEECCPPVTAPYLQAAYDRMKLGVRVHTGKDIHGVYIIVQDPRIRTVPIRQIIGLWNAGWPELCGDPRKATAAYLRLCDTLTEPAPPSSRAQTAGEQSSAHSIEPAAALIPADSPAVAAEVPPIANASAAPSIVGGL